jgi:hypothetical protein
MGTFRFSIVFPFAIGLHAAEPDWRAIQEETFDHFRHVLRIDTTNPPGNETQVAEYVKAVLEKDIRGHSQRRLHWRTRDHRRQGQSHRRTSI